ncbi:UNVERIFIED_CONTAM: hypothetical protein GTU68_060029 [Idotea baltica]|nr:hypothetical protein [Idotea baltica]
MNLLAGLQPADAGTYLMNGVPVTEPGPSRGILFQNYSLLPWLTVFGNIDLGSKAEHRQICEYYLNAVGLYDSMHKYSREISGGMQQRVGIARAIALKPRVLLLDEPFGRLDSLTRMDLQDVILNILDKQRITTVVITHDVDEAIYMSNRVCMMTNGPEATVGQILDVPFDFPRKRTEVLEHVNYYDFRACLLSFLEKQQHNKTQHVRDFEHRQKAERLQEELQPAMEIAAGA